MIPYKSFSKVSVVRYVIVPEIALCVEATTYVLPQPEWFDYVAAQKYDQQTLD